MSHEPHSDMALSTNAKTIDRIYEGRGRFKKNRNYKKTNTVSISE